MSLCHWDECRRTALKCRKFLVSCTATSPYFSWAVGLLVQLVHLFSEKVLSGYEGDTILSLQKLGY
jgi:hypothetical protein